MMNCKYVITGRGRFKPIFTLQSMKSKGRESGDVLEKGRSHVVLAGTASFTDRLLLRLFQFYVNHWKKKKLRQIEYLILFPQPSPR